MTDDPRQEHSTATPSDPAPAKRGLLASMSILEWTVTGLIVAGLAVVGSFLFYNLRGYSTMSQGVRSIELPWQGDGIAVTGLTTGWKKTQQPGELFCPEITITIQAVPDERGEVLVRFVDSHGDVMGDPLSFTYRDGKIAGRDGSTATLTCSRGIEGVTYINEYLLDQKEAWRYHVSYRKSGNPVVYLGSGDVARILVGN